MRSKIERAQRGPSGVEVILGALLSVVIGAVLGAAYLSVKPVPAVKEIPKDAAAGSVFYIEGLHDSGQGPEAGEKLRTLAAGGSVTLTETELNSLAGEAAKPQPSVAAKPGDKAAPAAAPAPPGPQAALRSDEQMTDVDRRRIQTALARLGYYDGKIDGIFGPESRAAIRRYQHELGAEMTGRLNATQASRLIAGQ